MHLGHFEQARISPLTQSLQAGLFSQQILRTGHLDEKFLAIAQVQLPRGSDTAAAHTAQTNHLSPLKQPRVRGQSPFQLISHPR